MNPNNLQYDRELICKLIYEESLSFHPENEEENEPEKETADKKEKSEEKKKEEAPLHESPLNTPSKNVLKKRSNREREETS